MWTDVDAIRQITYILPPTHAHAPLCYDLYTLQPACLCITTAQNHTKHHLPLSSQWHIAYSTYINPRKKKKTSCSPFNVTVSFTARFLLAILWIIHAATSITIAFPITIPCLSLPQSARCPIIVTADRRTRGSKSVKNIRDNH